MRAKQEILQEMWRDNYLSFRVAAETDQLDIIKNLLQAAPDEKLNMIRAPKLPSFLFCC